MDLTLTADGDLSFDVVERKEQFVKQKIEMVLRTNLGEDVFNIYRGVPYIQDGFQIFGSGTESFALSSARKAIESVPEVTKVNDISISTADGKATIKFSCTVDGSLIEGVV